MKCLYSESLERNIWGECLPVLLLADVVDGSHYSGIGEYGLRFEVQSTHLVMRLCVLLQLLERHR